MFNGHAEFKGTGPDFHSGQFFGGKFISAEVVGSGFGNQIGSPVAVSEIFSGQLFVLMAVTGVDFGIEFVSVLIRAVVASFSQGVGASKQEEGRVHGENFPVSLQPVGFVLFFFLICHITASVNHFLSIL